MLANKSLREIPFLYDAVMRECEIDPMYDAALIKDDTIYFWHYKNCNNANNGHSTTKLFIDSCVGILSDRGLLDVKAPVTSFFTKGELPAAIDPKWNKVTVHDAMRHRMGIDVVPYGVDEDDDIEKIGRDFLGYVFSLDLPYPPDEYYRYSDAAYYLLSRIIASVAGEPCQDFMFKNLLQPLDFRQWATAVCPQGHMIGGGGFFTRADDMAKLPYVYANGGVYDGKRILSERWTRLAIENQYALDEHRDTGSYYKTGAMGQGVIFKDNAAFAWHGCSPEDGGHRTTRLFDAFCDYLAEA
ncbi:MAG: serine hydrolase [Clostridia bacterium]|nr:serine hydrolase [Clostridia bacterium]